MKVIWALLRLLRNSMKRGDLNLSPMQCGGSDNLFFRLSPSSQELLGYLLIRLALLIKLIKLSPSLSRKMSVCPLLKSWRIFSIFLAIKLPIRLEYPDVTSL